MIPPPSKRHYLKILYLDPVLAIASVPTPSVTTVGSNPSTEEAAHQKPRRPSFCLAQLSDDSVEWVASVPSRSQVSCALSKEKIAELMKQIPCFTKREAPVHNMEALFPTTQRVLVDLESNLNISFDTPNTVISRNLLM